MHNKPCEGGRVAQISSDHLLYLTQAFVLASTFTHTFFVWSSSKHLFVPFLARASQGGGGVIGATWISSKHLHFQQVRSLSTSSFFLSLYFKLLFQAPSFFHFVSNFYFKRLFHTNFCSNKHLLSHISSPSLFFNTFFNLTQAFVPIITFFFHFIHFFDCHYLEFEDFHHDGVL
jgi:hypothetical protein